MVETTATPAAPTQSVLVLGKSSQGIAAGSGALKPQGQFTIEAWICPVSSKELSVILSEGDALFYIEAGELKFRANSTVEPIASSNAGLTAGTWHHVAIARRGSRPGDTKLYINGKQNDNQVAVPAIATIGSTYLGIHPGTENSQFQGKLLEVRVWRSARSQSEIQQNLTYCMTGRELGLVRCWSLLEGFGTTIGDKTTSRAIGSVEGETVTWEESELPLKVTLDPQDHLTRSTGLEDYAFWFKEMAKNQQLTTPTGYRRGRIWA